MKKATKKELEAAVVEARAALEARRAELWQADVAAAKAGGDESWMSKRSERRAQAVVETAKAETEAASVRLAEAETALEEHMAAQEMNAKSGFKAWTVAAKAEAARLTDTLKRQQAEMLETGRRLASLYVVGRKKAPRRILSRRSSLFLRVEVLDPAIRALYETADPPWTFRVEFFRAVRGEREGRWKILPGQSLDHGTVEIMWGDTGLPDELQAVEDIDLGYLYRANGSSGKLKNEKLNLHSIEHFLLSAEDLQAAENVAERA